MKRAGVKARLSPSGAERWLNCTASPWLEAVNPKSDSVFSEEGTLAHEVAELAWRSTLHQITPSEYDKASVALRKRITEAGFNPAMMFAHATTWQNAVRAVNDEYFTDWLFADVEYGVSLESLDEDLRGRVDFIGVFDGMLGAELLISDLKYGAGMLVKVESNPQQMLYAYGAYLSLPDHVRDLLDPDSAVNIQVAQVRLEGGVQTWATTLGEILEWVETTVEPAMASILDGGQYVPGSHCQFCTAAGACRARAEVSAAALGLDADMLTPEETAEWLDKADTVSGFIKALRDRALANILNGSEVPGWGVTRTNGQRRIVDVEEAISRLVASGFRQSDVSKRVMETLGNLDSLVGGKDELSDILGDTLVQTNGSLKLKKGATYTPAGNLDDVFPDVTDDLDW